MSLDPSVLIATFMQWINEGHEAIMWLSGITGLSSTVIIIIILSTGKSIARFFINLLKLVIILAVIFFALSLYVSTGHQLPTPEQFGIPSIQEIQAAGQGIMG